jgi:hypothetical protein
MEPSTVKKEKETAIGQMCIDFLVKIGRIWNCTFSHFRRYRNRIVFISTELKKHLNSILSIPVSSIFCIQDPNIEDLIAKFVSYGKQRMPIREYYPNEKPFKMCYVEDPSVFSKYTQLRTNLFFRSLHKINQ